MLSSSDTTPSWTSTFKISTSSPLPQSLSQPNETQTGGDNDKQRDWEQKQHSFTNPLQNHLNSSTKSSHNHKSKTNKNKTLNFLIRIPKSK